MTPEEILAKHCDCPMEHIERNIIMLGYKDLILIAMKEYGDQRFEEARDKALEWVEQYVEIMYHPLTGEAYLPNDISLIGKQSPDLHP